MCWHRVEDKCERCLQFYLQQHPGIRDPDGCFHYGPAAKHAMLVSSFMMLLACAMECCWQLLTI